MQCDQIQLELQAYLAGRLTVSERTAIDDHLAQCHTCAEEASAMRDLGRILSGGLTNWVNQGVCPPDVMARIEESLRPIQRHRWWQSWPAMAGFAAAAVLFLLLTARTDLPQGAASLPLVGGLAAQLFEGPPNEELFWEPVNQPTAATEHDGIRLTVDQASQGKASFGVQFTVQGESLDAAANMKRVQIDLGVMKQTPDLLDMTYVQGPNGEVRFTAYFPKVPAGEVVQLTVRNLPLRSGPATAETMWQVSFIPE